MPVELRTCYFSVIPSGEDGVTLNLGVLSDSDIQEFFKGDQLRIFLPFPVQTVEGHFVFEFQGLHDRSPALAYIQMSEISRSHLISFGDRLARILNTRSNAQKVTGIRELLSFYGKAIADGHQVMEDTSVTNEFLVALLTSANRLLDQNLF